MDLVFNSLVGGRQQRWIFPSLQVLLGERNFGQEFICHLKKPVVV
jgi:hypothetical protein